MKIKYLIPVFLLALSLPGNLFGQEREVKKLSHEKRHKIAHNLVNKGSYYNAVDHLKDLVKEHPENRTYAFRLADAYFFSRDYRNSEKAYDKIVKLDGKKTSLAMYRYAESLKYNAKYEEARDAFRVFAASKYKENQGERYKVYAKNEVASCEWAIKNLEKENPIDVVHLGDHVNSKYSEFGPCLMNDSVLIFSSIQSDSVITVDPDEPHPFHVKLLSSPKTDTLWGPHTALPTVNTVYENNANGTFSTDKKKFYFTRCLPNEKNEMICEIFVSELVDGVFQKAEKLNENINKKGFTSTQPFVGTAKVGKSVYEVLYFSSDRPNGKGGLDLYYALVNKDGSMQAPVNLGSNINTIRDEITPYCYNNGFLYFSSNYHFGFGGYDVFKSRGALNKWEKPVNILKPSNTRVDDTYFSIDNENNEGFLVSNRPEGYHLTSETCCDDIYSVKLKNPFVLKLYAFNLEDKKPLDKVKFSVLSRKADAGSLTVPEEVYKPDSTKMSKEELMLTYLNSNISKFDTSALDNLIENGRYKEIEDLKNLYDAAADQEYAVYAVNNKDTVIFTFTTDKVKHKVDKYWRFDTLTVHEVVSGRNIDVVKIYVYFSSDTVDETIALKDTARKEILEDEKAFTVTKMIDDLKHSKKAGLKVILNYDFDDANFIEKHSGSLDSLVTMMKNFPEVKIDIAAHTDNKGSDKYNEVLSKKRAKSIVDYISKHGIDRKRMTSEGKGEAEPIVPNSNPDGSDNPENRWLNRRAEITIIE
jgi:outer membrane protein OmpA-like peptidoglycan-associated protein